MKIVKYISVLGLAFVFIAFTSDTESKLFTITKNMELFANVYKELSKTYVDEVEPAGLMRTALTAMLKDLDPYTNYITEAQIEDAKLKKFGGGGDIGVKLIQKDGEVLISEVLEGLPADLSGLKAGDVIKAIDGKPMKDKSLDDIQLFLQGQPGTEVDLEMIPYGDKNITEKSVPRIDIKPKDITFSKMLNDTVGYVKLTTFLSRGCGKFVNAEIQKLKDENEGFKYLVFDLRGNPGGLLSESILVSNIFVEKDKMIVVTKGRDPENVQELKSPAEPTFPDIPLVVLTNNKSASASEIVSGTIQDFDRGVVIGQRTYGKGLVQRTMDIGFNSKVKLTIAKYYINSGRCVQAVDYYGEYTDAGAQQIADSLKNEFRTLNGRIVYDNSGVEPDILIENDKNNTVIKGINENHLIFDYANLYASKHDSIAAPLDFEITDKDFQDFVKFTQTTKKVTSKEGKTEEILTDSKERATFQFETEDVLEDLQKATESENYFESVKAELATLKDKLNEIKTSGLAAQKAEIKKQLKYEILNRFYYDKGRLEASLNDDPEVQEAFKLFGDMDRYNKILGN